MVKVDKGITGCCLGIDGGATRTTAWLADGEGKVLARAETGPTNPFKVGLRTAESELLKAFRACCRVAGFPLRAAGNTRPAKLQAVCAGIAGVDRPSVSKPLLAWMRLHIPARHHLLTSDCAIALAAAVGGRPGIIVNAGTGSFAFARDNEGKLLRAGGWGIPFDDRGSGYELGRRAVASSLEAFDGRGPNTVLMGRICARLGLNDINSIISKRLEQQQIAALFPLVMEAARDGDLVARHLCDEAGRDLAGLAAALLKRAGWTECAIPVVTTGGVFRSSQLVRRAFARHLRRIAPHARVELLARQPVEGALWLAQTSGKERHQRKSIA